MSPSLAIRVLFERSACRLQPVLSRIVVTCWNSVGAGACLWSSRVGNSELKLPVRAKQATTAFTDYFIDG
jgi:hypothetical protein